MPPSMRMPSKSCAGSVPRLWSSITTRSGRSAHFSIGSCLAERLVSVGNFVETHPTVRKLLESAHRHSAADAFAGMHKLKELIRAAEAEWAKVQILLLPTAPTIYKVEEMLADPIGLNARLGRYSQFVNFLGCPAIAVPLAFAKTACLLGSLSLPLLFTMTPWLRRRQPCMRLPLRSWDCAGKSKYFLSLPPA